MRNVLNFQILYKFSLLTGITVSLATPFFGWSYVQQMERQATRLFEQTILAKLDLGSLQSQYQSLQQVTGSNTASENPIEYSERQMKVLEAEALVVGSQVNKLQARLDTLEQAKTAITSKIKIAFITAVLLMSGGIVLTLAGFLGWYFHVQIFSERRSKPRAAE